MTKVKKQTAKKSDKKLIIDVKQLSDQDLKNLQAQLMKESQKRKTAGLSSIPKQTIKDLKKELDSLKTKIKIEVPVEIEILAEVYSSMTVNVFCDFNSHIEMHQIEQSNSTVKQEMAKLKTKGTIWAKSVKKLAKKYDVNLQNLHTLLVWGSVS